MAWKLGTAVATFIGLAAWASAPVGEGDARRAAWRAEFRPPAAIPFPDDNPYTPAKAELGRRLFFDPILSGDGTRSCGTCHVPDLGWSDGRPRAASLKGGVLDLRTPTLLNVAWQDGPLGWDGKFRSLEAVATAPMAAPANMNLPLGEALARLSEDEGYRTAFATAFGGEGVTRERLLAALATFERLIVSGPAPFDRWISGDEGAIDAAAKRGFDLFNGRAGCAGCHSGWSFTDGSFHDIGVAGEAELGRGRLMPTSPALRHAFKTPTLRDVARRAPYMHNGSLATLETVIDLYDRGGIDRPSRSRSIRPLNLTAGERADLVAFLGTLSAAPDRDLTAATPASVPVP